jgi:hypothetical protein
VLETDVASKVNALNLGDREAVGFPRAYIDGDVVVTAESLWRMVEQLRSGRGLATAPFVRWDLGEASAAVRAFYAIDGRLPSSREGIGGTGVYVLSEEGRRRFGEFPAITGDDTFVRGHFSPDERRPTEGAFSVVTPPRTLAGVITIKTRSHYGNYEIAPRLASLARGRGRSNWPALLKLMLRPTLWPGIAVYVYAKCVAKARARRQIRGGRAPRWHRDETSRSGGDSAPPASSQTAVGPPRGLHVPAS